MSLKQIEYIDKLLPFFGCSGVEDEESLFNKTTITDWEKLQSKLAQEISTIKNIICVICPRNYLIACILV
jgi:hypothetical protein